MRRNPVPWPNIYQGSPKIHPKVEVEDIDTDINDDNDNDNPETGTAPPLLPRRYKDIDSDDDGNANNGEFEMDEVDGRDVITRHNDYYETNLSPLGVDVTHASP